MVITGIGSRQTPANILKEMILIGAWCLENGHYIRSGHADGADYAFEVGAKQNCICYLPWSSFNNNLRLTGAHLLVPDNILMNKYTDHFHPNAKNLSEATRKMVS